MFLRQGTTLQAWNSEIYLPSKCLNCLIYGQVLWLLLSFCYQTRYLRNMAECLHAGSFCFSSFGGCSGTLQFRLPLPLPPGVGIKGVCHHCLVQAGSYSAYLPSIIQNLKSHVECPDCVCGGLMIHVLLHFLALVGSLGSQEGVLALSEERRLLLCLSGGQCWWVPLEGTQFQAWNITCLGNGLVIFCPTCWFLICKSFLGWHYT